MAMQTYFPDVKIPAATMKRVQSAMQLGKSSAAGADLTDALNKSLEEVKKRKAASQ